MKTYDFLHIALKKKSRENFLVCNGIYYMRIYFLLMIFEVEGQKIKKNGKKGRLLLAAAVAFEDKRLRQHRRRRSPRKNSNAPN